MPIPQHESLEIEFKSDTTGEAARGGLPDVVLVETAVALFNTDGGRIYLGVEDDGTPSGVCRRHADPVGVAALIANRTMPSIRVSASIEDAAGVDVMVIEVPKGGTVASTSDGKMLKRRMRAGGDPQSVPMYPFEIATRLGDLGRLDMSAEPVYELDEDGLDPVEVARLRHRVESTPSADKALVDLPDADLLMALGLLVRVGESVHPTVAGLLVAGRKEQIAAHVPTARYSFQVLAGSEVRLNVEDTLPMLSAIERFEEYFSARNAQHEVEDGFVSLAVHDYDARAFREAVVNALSHRDYTLLRPVRVLMEDEGVTVSSPGGFVEGVTRENLLTVAPHGRNPTLAEALKRIGLAEKTGRGVDRIYEGSLRYGRPLPDYGASTGSDVVLFIPKAESDDDLVKAIYRCEQRAGRSMTVYELLALDAARGAGGLDVARLARSTGIAAGIVERAAASLVDMGLIRETGGGYVSSAGSMQAAPSGAYGRLLGASRDKEALADAVLSLARRKGSLSRSELIDELGVTLAVAKDVLKRLVERGQLRLEGAGRGSRYYANGEC